MDAKTEERLVEVAVAVPVPGTFTYRVPERWAAILSAGHRVLVPFGKRRLTGYVLGEAPPPPEGTRLREVAEVLDDGPMVPEALVPFLRWTSEYYLHPLGEVIRTALPPGINVQTERRVRLTEAGRLALEEASTPPEDRDVLALLVGPEGDASGAGVRVGGRSGAFDGRTADRLLARGWVERVAGLTAPRVRAREVEYVSALPGGEDPEVVIASLSRAPAQSAVLAWLAARGRVPMDELRAAFPRARDAVVRLVERKLVILDRASVDRAPEDAGLAGDAGATPDATADQQAVLRELEAALGGGFAPFLLHGVTGSGKTEVYMRLIESARARGLGALVLVPEIALTPQLVGRFRGRFGDAVALLHSGLSDGERHDEWWRIRRGEATVAVGVRSAIFAPVQNLGVVVVDEEHEGSFKQEEGLRYHARDLALVRGRDAGALVLLGSATPSLESLQNVRAGRYRRLSLPRRVEDRPLPTVELIDLRREAPPRPADPEAEPHVLSERLRTALEETIAAGRQAILFLNRRGHTAALLCTDCGEPLRCPNCEVGLTLHRRPPRLLCHYCAYEVPVAETCAGCGGPYQPVGTGTQRIEDEVLARVPGAVVARLDRDTTARRGALARVLSEFARGRANVLVGTQMVAKGHDFPGVTLVGVVLADLGLVVPDFRAAERTFQLLAQVAGRAGRGHDPGRVLVQSWRPEHPAVQLAAAGDFARFADESLAEREAQWWPPVSRLLLVRIDGTSPSRVEETARLVAQTAGRAARARPELDLEVLGPAPAPLSKLRGRTRWQVLVRAPVPRSIAWMGRLLRDLEPRPGVQIGLDVDPVGMM